MDIDFDIDAFYREQDKRMNLPDEDFNEYLTRRGTRMRSVLLYLAHLSLQRMGSGKTQIAQRQLGTPPPRTLKNLNTRYKLLKIADHFHLQILRTI
jgi:hypothetical protein